MSDDVVLLKEEADGTAVVTLNRPKIHNAFNADLIERLSHILEKLHGAAHVRLVYVTAAGKSFSAGADVEWMAAAATYSYAENRKDAEALAHMLHLLHTLPMPSICLVDGAARGGGLGLIAACDMAIATRRSNFALSEVKLGLSPATISPYVMKSMGERQLQRYALTGETFDAETAARLGLVTSVVDGKMELNQETESLSAEILQNGPAAVRATKTLLRHVSGMPIDESLRASTAERIADIRATDEAKEGLKAFLEKRKPDW